MFRADLNAQRMADSCRRMEMPVFPEDKFIEAVEKVVRGVIEERMELEQFSECNITMEDLTIIRKTLVETLSGVYHHRVKYPGIKYAKGDDGSARGEV